MDGIFQMQRMLGFRPRIEYGVTFFRRNDENAGMTRKLDHLNCNATMFGWRRVWLVARCYTG